MRQDFNVKVLFGNNDFESMKALPAKPVFSEDVCTFLSDLSTAIMKNSAAKRYPDIVSFGFYCRKANIQKLKETYFEELRIGRGFSFHIAPSNVPINFAFSLVFGLLSGNACVVRASSKKFEQTHIVCDLMNAVANEDIKKYISVVQYERDKSVNDYLSSLSDVRVIWGGDNTIEEIRKSSIPSRCVEVTFADRYSICVLDAKYVNAIDDFKRIANDFYNDTYLYDQNACSSPRLMYWIGTKDETKEAKNAFWNGISDYVKNKYTVEPVIAVEKLLTEYRIAIDTNKTSVEKMPDNIINRVSVSDLDFDVSQYACAGGIFIEYSSETIDDLKRVVNKKFQTMAYLGGNPEDYADFVVSNGLSGIDRIVPVGKTSDITLTWDGYNLIDTMSRKVFVE